jgi:hypothetical protein
MLQVLERNIPREWELGHEVIDFARRESLLDEPPGDVACFRWVLPDTVGWQIRVGAQLLVALTAVVVIRKSPPSVQVLDEEQIPNAFKQVVTSIDKALLRRALLDNQVIAGARLVHGRHLLIR